ncbi:MAG TPA: glycosyltransferase, partial [Paludibacter sp.]|nr:glycosyltransferase [Paludibacter sp.]
RFGCIAKVLQHRPQIVIGLEFTTMTFFTALFCRLFMPSTRVYTMCDDSLEVASTAGPVRRAGRRMCLALLDGLVLCNEPAQQWYAARFPRVRTIVSPIIQDEERIGGIIRAARGISGEHARRFGLQGKAVLLYVGRLTAVKNLGFLLEAFAMYAPAHPRAQLVLVGDGDKRKELEEQARRLGVAGRVVFAGRYEHRELYAWYPLADCFILPSLWEPFGAVVNEALIAGVPVLCSSVAGAACLVTPRNGRIISPHDKQQLVEALSLALPDPPAAFDGAGQQKPHWRKSAMPYSFGAKIGELVMFLEQEKQGSDKKDRKNKLSQSNKQT